MSGMSLYGLILLCCMSVMVSSWSDHEDIAIALYEKFGDEFGEAKIYRIRFTDLLEWILELPNFEGKREDCNEGHLEMIQSQWVYEWRDNQD